MMRIELTETSDIFSMQLAERLARLVYQQGKSESAVTWVLRLTYALSEALANGQSCLNLCVFAQAYQISSATLVGQLYAEQVLSQDAHDRNRVLLMADQQRIYFARYYDYERRLAKKMVALSRAPFSLNKQIMKAILQTYFPAQGEALDWQAVAAYVALSGRLTCISGGPGTGKTTTIAGILASLLSMAPDLQIALAAPTGKAAQRMQEALMARMQDFPVTVQQRMPTQALTLHRLLGQTAQGHFRYHQQAPLPFDVVVIDEASMMDLHLSMHLFEALADDARLILLGDKDQLSAVEAGAVFAELTRCPQFDGAFQANLRQFWTNFNADPVFEEAAAAMNFEQPNFEYRLDREKEKMCLANIKPLPQFIDYFTPPTVPFCPSQVDLHPSTALDPLCNRVVWLQKNYRFDADSPIGRLAILIREGKATETIALLKMLSNRPPADERVIWHHDQQATLQASDWQFFLSAYEGYLTQIQALNATQAIGDLSQLMQSFNQFRILTVMRQGLRGTVHVNQQMSVRVMHALKIPVKTWYVGRPVMINSNDYALGLFNGDIGLTLLDQDGQLKVCFSTMEGAVKKVLPDSLPAHETAWAMTVHKSQGSEFKRIALVMPEKVHPIASRQLVYTAVTRAKQRVDLLADEKVLSTAVMQTAIRENGLIARLQEMSGGVC